MKKLLGLILTLLALSTGAFAKKANIHILNFHSLKHTKYLILPTHKNARWKNSTVYWWYNPSKEHYDTNAAVNTLKRAMRKWENVCSIKFIYRGITYSSQIDGGVVVGWTSRRYLKDAAAVSISVPYGKYIRYGQILINYDEFNDVNYNLAEFEGIMVHEVGHIIGLDHSNVPSSVMYANPYHEPLYMLTLKQDDIRGARALYPLHSQNHQTTNTNSITQKNADYFLDKFYQRYRNYFGKKRGGHFDCGRGGSFRCQIFNTGKAIAVHKRSHNIYFYNRKWYYFGDGDRYW